MNVRMRRVVERTLGTVAAVAAAGALGWLSHVPLVPAGSEEGTLRLAWRARPERIERCEEPAGDALDQVPQHMRQTVICQGENATYRLEVWRNGVLAAGWAVRGGGLRHDRPLYVFHEVVVPTGESEVTVRFTREQTGVPDLTDTERRREELLEAVPPRLVYEARLSFHPRQVRVISYDPEQRELFEVRRP